MSNSFYATVSPKPQTAGFVLPFSELPNVFQNFLKANKKSFCELSPEKKRQICLFPYIPAAYIKVYLLENGVCVAKKKTKAVRKSLDPLYNQVLVFSESPQGKVVQVRTNREEQKQRIQNILNENMETLTMTKSCLQLNLSSMLFYSFLAKIQNA